MTPAARFAALMEITDLLLMEWQRETPRPAEQVIKAYTRSRRYIGGGDRRAIQESVFTLLRQFGMLKARVEASGLPLTGRSLALLFAGGEASALCMGGGYGPSALSAVESSVISRQSSVQGAGLPLWLCNRLVSQYGEEAQALVAALLQPAPLDLRVNRLKATREEAQRALAAEGIETTPIEGLPDALEAPRHAAVAKAKAYLDGWVEIQDRGSQGVCTLLADHLQSERVRGAKRSGERSDGGDAPFEILDYCAGAGGKSLALASRLGENCRITAYDADPERLKELAPRVKRAGLESIHLCYKENDLPEQADLVLLDVPCSGTGTIRRHPDLPWRLIPKKLEYYQMLQRSILRQTASKVKSGGLLAYVTCSLLESENSQCVNDFLTEFPNFQVVIPGQIWNKDAERDAPWLRPLPHRQGSDGFFAAVLKND